MLIGQDTARGELWFTLIRDQNGGGGAIDQLTLPAR
jgi:hypothetical protein